MAWYIGCGFFLCPVIDISATVPPIGRRQVFSHFGGGTPEIPKSEIFGLHFWPLAREYLENGKSQRYMSIRA